MSIPMTARNVDIAKSLQQWYAALFDHYGPQGWWPSEHATETIIGCILVQHTTWRQTTQALDRLRERHLLDFAAMGELSQDALADIVRPAGTPQVKARRLLAFAVHLREHHGGRLESLLEQEPCGLRRELLEIHGIGPESADCIVLYAGGAPAFVADAYARRVLRRHHLVQADWTYSKVQTLVETHLAPDADMLGEFHALLVQVGKQHCRPRARCEGCPLAEFEHDSEA